MPIQIQLRRGSADQWTTANPILAEGELAVELDTHSFKIGNGINHWQELSYVALPSATSSLLGGIKIGSGLSIDNNSVVSVQKNIYHYEFTNSIEWHVQHNMNTRFFVERITDINGHKIFASISILDSNSFTVNLTEASSGSVDVVFNTLL